uniref:CD72 molecule n=1 Tax=Nothoprocta perdicaria TaxID=30464 RepID=A0A8C6Z1Q9_NOTPE
MAQSGVYADLRFAKVPTGRSMACQALEAALGMDEAESPYENTPPGQAPAGQDEQGGQPSPGPWRRLRSVPVGLLAACLLLLATAIALGACYWQVTRRLQEASRAHAAERGRLSEQVSVREQRLEQMDLELARAREELQRAWLEANSSQLEAQSLDVELGRTMGVLGMMEKELQDVKGKLNASESTVSSLRSCSNIDCCPSGWVLYRGKCLFISAEKKTWEDSRTECDTKISQLLITKSWSRWTVPVPCAGRRGLGALGAEKAWKGARLWKSNGSCAIISHGSIKPAQCDGDDDVHFWICEKAPGPSSPFM